MKLVSYIKEGHDQLAVLIKNYLYDMELLHPDLPNSMGLFLNYWEDVFPVAQEGVRMIGEGKIAEKEGYFDRIGGIAGACSLSYVLP